MAPVLPPPLTWDSLAPGGMGSASYPGAALGSPLDVSEVAYKLVLKYVV